MAQAPNPENSKTSKTKTSHLAFPPELLPLSLLLPPRVGGRRMARELFMAFAYQFWVTSQGASA
jgi:hypothetical protein